MRLLSYILIYALSLILIAALAKFVGDTATAQIISSFEQVLSALQTLK